MNRSSINLNRREVLKKKIIDTIFSLNHHFYEYMTHYENGFHDVVNTNEINSFKSQGYIKNVLSKML